MTGKLQSIVVIGAGQAGAEAVRSLRMLGYSGRLTLVGDENLLPYQRPPLSKGYLGGAVEAEALTLRPHRYYRDSDVALILDNPAMRIDRDRRTVQLADGRILNYDRLLLATGARAREIDIPGAANSQLLQLRGRADADRLRQAQAGTDHLTIIGGGYIGLEVASTARRAGLGVRIIERAGRVLERVTGDRIGAYFHDLHSREGVEIVCDASVSEITQNGGTNSFSRLADGRLLPTDVILCGVGAAPNAEIALEAGLRCEGGIVVDSCCRTSDPAIYAAGDCATGTGIGGGAHIRIESVWNAVNQAARAAAHMLGAAMPDADAPWFWSDQYDVKLQTAGLRDRPDRSVMRGDPLSGKFSVFYYRDGLLQASDSVNDAAAFMTVRRALKTGRSIDPDTLADPAIPMKAIMAGLKAAVS